MNVASPPVAVTDALDDADKRGVQVADSLTLLDTLGVTVWIIDTVCVLDIIAVMEFIIVTVDKLDLLGSEVIEDLVLNVAVLDTEDEGVADGQAVGEVECTEDTDKSGLFERVLYADVDNVAINDANGELETEALAEWVTRFVNVSITVENAVLDISDVRVKIADNEEIIERDGIADRDTEGDELELPLTREDLDADEDAEGDCVRADDCDADAL